LTLFSRLGFGTSNLGFKDKAHLVSLIPSAFDINNKPLSKKGSINQRVTWNGMHFCLVSSTFSDDSQVGEDETIGITKGKLIVGFNFFVSSFINMDDKMKSLGFVKDWFFGWVRIISLKELRLQFRIACEQKNIGPPCLICGRHLSSCPNI
jgi:hypothetical protein